MYLVCITRACNFIFTIEKEREKEKVYVIYSNNSVMNDSVILFNATIRYAMIVFTKISYSVT